MLKPRPDRNIIVGFAWFDRAQWQRLMEVADDRNKLDDTFEQWERNALDALGMFERQGQRAEKVHVDVDALVSWCKDKQLPINGASRSQYVSFVLQQRDGQAKV